MDPIMGLIAELAALAEHPTMGTKKKATTKKSLKFPDSAPEQLTSTMVREAVLRLLDLAAAFELESGSFDAKAAVIHDGDQRQRSLRAADQSRHEQLLHDIVRLLEGDRRESVDEDFHEVLTARLLPHLVHVVSWTKAEVTSAECAAAMVAAETGAQGFPDPPAAFAANRWLHVRAVVFARLLPRILSLASSYFGQEPEVERIRAAFRDQRLVDLFERDPEAFALELIGRLSLEGQTRAATTLREHPQLLQEPQRPSDRFGRVAAKRGSVGAQIERSRLRCSYALAATRLERFLTASELDDLLSRIGTSSRDLR